MTKTISACMMVKLTFVHDEDPVGVHDGVDPVRDGEHRVVGKLLPDGLLKQRVRLVVNARRRLINAQHL